MYHVAFIYDDKDKKEDTVMLREKWLSRKLVHAGCRRKIHQPPTKTTRMLQNPGWSTVSKFSIPSVSYSIFSYSISDRK